MRLCIEGSCLRLAAGLKDLGLKTEVELKMPTFLFAFCPREF